MGIPGGGRKRSCLVGSEQRRKGSLGSLLRCVHRCFYPGVGHESTYVNINRSPPELTGGGVSNVGFGGGWGLTVKLSRAVRKRWLWAVDLSRVEGSGVLFWSSNSGLGVDTHSSVLSACHWPSRWELNAMTTNSNITRPIVSSHG